MLKFGDLLVEFGPQAPAPAVETCLPGIPATPDTVSPSSSATEIAAAQSREAENSLVADEVAVRREQLSLMWIENPHEAEKIFMSEELEDDDDDQEA